MKLQKTKPDSLDHAPIRSNRRKAISILIIFLFISLLATHYTMKDEESGTNAEFKLVCNDLKTKMIDRLHAHAGLLRSGSAFFASTDAVSRKQWKKFYENSKTSANLPGIQGLGFSMIIPSQELQKHIDAIRKEGFPTYSIKPNTSRKFYTSIVYIEPFSGRNLRAFGYDMYTEPVRRKAMEAARDWDVAMLSGKVTLVQETNKDVQAGTLMYVPVYKNGESIVTLSERRKAIIGWVYSPYRMNDLMQGILGRWDSITQNRIHLQIYDGNEIQAQNILFDSQTRVKAQRNYKEERKVLLSIDFNGKRWLLKFTQPKQLPAQSRNKVIIVFLSGIMISCLLFFLFLSLLNTKHRALHIAKKLTAELYESESRFKNMFQRHNSIMLLIEPESGNIIDANISASTFYGYSIQQLCSMTIADISTMTKEEISANRIKAKDGLQNYFVFKHRLSNNDEKIVEVHSSPIVYLGEKILFSIIHDITERTEIEKALAESEKRWKFAIEGANDGLWDWNIQNSKVFYSAQWKAMLGYDESEIENDLREWNDRVHPEDLKTSYAEINKHLKGNSPFYHNLHRLRCKDDSYKWILARGKIVEYDENQKPTRMIGTHTDMTERMEMERKLRLLNADKDRFLSMMAHDLKSPFTAILGFLDLLKRKLHEYTTEQVVGHIGMVEQSAQNTYDLLDDMLAWSRAQANKLSFKPEVLCVNDLIKDVANNLILGAKNKNIDLYFALDKEVLILADKNMANAVLRNLISNAIKFTPRNGMVRIGQEEKETLLVISVSDNGVGISKADQAKLFDNTQIFTTYGTENEKGTGFGLLLCKDFVEKHGGEIWIESEQGKGSTFSFTMPKYLADLNNTIQ